MRFANFPILILREDTLEQNVGLNVEDVTVIVENGVENGKVTLTGVVSSIAIQQAIVDIVSYTGGVSEIINSLTVSSL